MTASLAPAAPVAAPPPPDIAALAATLALLGSPTRLRAFFALADGPQNVGALDRLTGGPGQLRPRISGSLRMMTLAGLIEVVRDGQFRVYSLSPAGRRLHAAIAAFAAEKGGPS